MASITIKDIPARIHERIRERARANRRSLQQEILACLEQAVLPRSRTARQIIREARGLSSRFGIGVDHDATDRYRRQGRS